MLLFCCNAAWFAGFSVEISFCFPFGVSTSFWLILTSFSKMFDGVGVANRDKEEGEFCGLSFELTVFFELSDFDDDEEFGVA